MPDSNSESNPIDTLTQKEMLFCLRVLHEQQTKEKKQAAKAAQERAMAARDQAKARARAEREKARAAARERTARTRATKIAAAAQPDAAASSNPDAPDPAAPKPSLCHHIMPSGRRCRSIRCNQTRYCYFHSGELQRKHASPGMSAHYRLSALPVIEDRASVQIVLNEIIRSYISDAIDSRKAGILLYGMNIALANLRHDDQHVIAEDDAVANYTNVSEHDHIAELDEEESAAYAAEQEARTDQLNDDQRNDDQLNDDHHTTAREDAIARYYKAPAHDPAAQLDEEESAAFPAEQNLRADKIGVPDPTPRAKINEMQNPGSTPAATAKQDTATPLSPAARTPAPRAREGNLAPEPISSWIELPLLHLSAERVLDFSEKSHRIRTSVPIANRLSPHLP